MAEIEFKPCPFCGGEIDGPTSVQLHRQNVLLKEQLGHLADCNPTKQDFENQRKAYQLIVDYFEDKAQNKMFDKEA